MNKLLTILLLASTFSAARTQAQILADGFYLATDCSINATYKRTNRLDERRTICLAQQPILSIREIDRATGIIDAGSMHYFDVYLTPKATQQLITIKTTLNKSTIALVVDNAVVFIIEPDYKIERILRIIVLTQTADLGIVREKIIEHVAKAKSR